MMQGLRLIVVIALLGALSACTSASGYSDLDRAATSDDVLPGLPADSSDDLDLGSVRYVGTHEGRTFYLARADPQPGVCVAIYLNAESWIVGCGTEVTVGGTGISVSVIPDGGVVPEGATLVGNNVVILQSSGS